MPAGYRCDVVYGENVRSLAVALHSEGVMSNDRIAAFMNAANGGGLGCLKGAFTAAAGNLLKIRKKAWNSWKKIC